MKILILASVWPEPRSSAAGSRTLQLIQGFLDQDYTVSIASAAKHTEYEADLEALGVDTHAIELNSSSFDDFITQLQPNIVVFDRFMTEEQFSWRVAEACPQAMHILDTQDLHFLRDARRKAIQANHKDKTDLDLQTDLAKREVAAIYRADLSLIISAFEYRLLIEDFSVPEVILHYLPFMLEPPTQQAKAILPSFKERKHFISIGNFLHAPNWDAVLQLKTTIWPRIRQALPDAELHVYGAYPPQKAFALHSPKDGFLVKGRAEDAYKVLREARVLLAPLRFGAGLKGKLIDAMQCGVPSVTSSIGTEGISDGAWAGFREDDMAAFATSAIQLYTDESLWTQKQAVGFELLSQFDKANHLPSFLQRIREIHDDLSLHRSHNFIGKMLRHHTMQSTKYMSRWIEAKNKAVGEDA
ncbi:MAG: glycosyltransferase [Deinococcota bacterium]